MAELRRPLGLSVEIGFSSRRTLSAASWLSGILNFPRSLRLFAAPLAAIRGPARAVETFAVWRRHGEKRRSEAGRRSWGGRSDRQPLAGSLRRRRQTHDEARQKAGLRHLRRI